MAQMPPKVADGVELVQAQAELWCHTFGCVKFTALQCAIKLRIPTAIHNCGGSASLSELHASLPVPARKRPCLLRLMKALCVFGILGEDEVAGVYCLTPVSRLLIDGANGGSHACLSQWVALARSSFLVEATLRLPEWLVDDGGDAAETPFMMAHGTGFWGVAGRDAEFGALFNEAMGADSRFVAEIVVRECSEVFAGVRSLVDVGGGEGTMAKAVAKAFPHVSCSVLELRQVVEGLQVDDTIEFVAGDMMSFIPPGDAVLLKFVLHNWSDEDCVRILKGAKEAISTREPKGKVIIIDTVVGSASRQTYEAQVLMDLCMMVVTTGEERHEEKWHRIFLDAGFSQYKISPIYGPRSIIEVYP
ncbi:hypothetical protein ACP70R_004105 [Stipagrostis hirtigluma subsp. patula]